MTPAELAAYIGAAAWLPQIGIWLHRWLATPQLRIVLGRSVELGFTSLGPIFNVHVAFTTERKPLVINSLNMRLAHEDGDVHEFIWSGIQEDLGETRDAAGLTQGRLQKDKVPIAIKITTETLLERFIRFQEPRFRETDRPIFMDLVAHFEHLERTAKDDHIKAALESKELFALLDSREKSFWWKAGTYTVWLRPSSASRFSLASPICYKFTLERWMADALRRNIAQNRIEVENAMRSAGPGPLPPQVRWNWVNPDLRS